MIYTNGTATPLVYYYVLNLQGDVVKLVNATGESRAEYTYNAWGEVLSATGIMAAINPLRYRGYYYDTETDWYYLQSRYYDPVTHRFINADGYVSTDSDDAVACNMFTYCGNNPVNSEDPTGEAPWSLLPYWGYIHKKVQKHIQETNGELRLQLEQYVYFSDGSYGRIDILMPSTGQIWEVKSCGPASLLAPAQLAWYTTGSCSASQEALRIGEQQFSGEFSCGDFIVKYWSTAPGVILYDFWKKPKEETDPVMVPEKNRAYASAGGINTAMAGTAAGGVITAWAYSYLMGRNATGNMYYASR